MIENAKSQIIVEKKKVDKPIALPEKGWKVDDTKTLEVNYLTIEDIINPIRMTNQHERYVREMIWYIRKVEKIS